MRNEHTFDHQKSGKASGSGCVRSAARSYMQAVLGVVDSSPLGVAIDVFDDLRGMIDAAQARRLAHEVTDDGDARQAQRKAANSRRISKREAARRAKAAAAVKKNSTLGDMVENGDLSSEQLDTIADAMRTDESAATDQGLIDAVASASVDQGRTIGREWATKKSQSDKVQSEHDQQRAGRRAAMYLDKTTGLSAIKVAGDGASTYQLWKLIEAEEQRLWRMDGGRDIPDSKHRRTKDQRLFDAAMNLLSGEGTAKSGAMPVTVIGVGIDKLTGDSDACAELIGHGPIADSVAIDLIAKSDLIINILGLKGESLWWGRAKRHAPTSLRIALAMRDKACVQCGAPWQKCQAHHLMPWHAPGKGETNLDDMAFMCEPCHHELHAMELTLYRSADGTWRTRAATPNETPPRHPRTKRPSRNDLPSRAPNPVPAGPPKARRPKPKQPEPANTDDPATPS